MTRDPGLFCGLCGQPESTCAGACAPLHTLDPPRWCTVCGHRLDVQVYPNHIESSCKVCRVRRARAEQAQHAQQQ